MFSVGEVTAPSRERFYREFVVPARPAIINDYAPWPAFEKWSLAYFREHFGRQMVQLPSGSARLADFLDRVERSSRDSPSEYLNQVPLFREFPALVEDISPYPETLDPNWIRSRLIPKAWGMRDSFCELFIGGEGAGFSLLHFDQYFVNTYITQVVGDKEFTLFAPEDSHLLYPRSDSENLSSVGPLDRVDLDRFPLFAQATPLQVTVRAGQTIFVPRGVWHASKLLNPSIAVAMSSANSAGWSRFTREFSNGGNAGKVAAKRTWLGAVGLFKKWSE